MKKEFKPTRLYIKRINDLWYFGKSTSENISKYSGSGKIWSDKIKKYGKDAIVTEWVSDWYFDAEEISKIAVGFSIENDIVNSKKWANLKIENGIDGGAFPHTIETKAKISAAIKGKTRSTYTKSQMSKGKLGANHPLFSGYYMTPWGKFESSYEAYRRIPDNWEYSLSQSAINNYCKSRNQTALPRNGSIYKEWWGKTPKELGFYFIPKNI